MFTLLSPAKSLDMETPFSSSLISQPRFLPEAQELIEQLRQLAPQDLSNLMKISDKLASLNAARFEQWHLPFDTKNAKAALMAFTGDVYQGLDAPSLSEAALEFSQEHLGILSGLYGLLRPLDLIQAYRLEMGTKFANLRGADLYAFWRPLVTQAIKQLLDEQDKPVVINLASQEYFKAVDTQALNRRIITPVFKDWKNDNFKIISFYAKKARGLMARFILEEKIDHPSKLQDFNLDGYKFNKSMSEEDTWVFLRKEAE